MNESAPPSRFFVPAVTRKILIIGDDLELREELGERLIEADDLDVFEAEPSADCIQRARLEIPDLVLLDVAADEIDGLDLCRRMRIEGIGCPIILIAGRTDDGAVVSGLESGANDYVVKPFNFPVLLARIRSHLRQHEESGEAMLPVGPYGFFPRKRIVRDQARKIIRLTEKETRILRRLVDAGGRSVSRSALLRELWAYPGDVTTHTLETHIYRMRRKLEPDPKRPSMLLTVSGGYRLAAFPQATVRRAPFGSGAPDAGRSRRGVSIQKETGR